MNYAHLDEAMLPFFEFVHGLSDIEGGHLVNGDESVSMSIESIAIETPFELDFQIDSDGTMTIGASPPMYYVQTTIKPIFHSMKLRMVEDVKQQTNYGS